jgi:hypothetical protein
VIFYLAAAPLLAWALFCLLLGGYLEVTDAKPASARGGFVVVVFCMPFVALWDWVTGE